MGRDTGTFQCAQCSKVYKTQAWLIKHTTSIHATTSSTKGENFPTGKTDILSPPFPYTSHVSSLKSSVIAAASSV